MTKRGERFHTEALAVASFKAVKNGWGGTMRQRPGGMRRHDRVSKRETERRAEREICPYTAALQQHSQSGLLTLAFSANCYSVTLLLFPGTLDLQSQDVCNRFPCTIMRVLVVVWGCNTVKMHVKTQIISQPYSKSTHSSILYLIRSLVY